MFLPQKLIWAFAVLCGLLISLVSGLPPDKGSTSGRTRAGTVAVVFSDIKFDDKAAIWSLLRDPQYAKVLVITSGIDSHYTAASSLLRFINRQNSLAATSLHVDKNKLDILHGHNGLGIPAPHEVWYNDLAPTQFNDISDRKLRTALQGRQVAIFQIAPTPLEDVLSVVRNAESGSVKSLMLLHGYNSRQITLEEQERFLSNLRPWLRLTNPQAEVYFTSSFASYAARDGGKHPLQWVRAFFPSEEVEQALKDPFWSEQLRRGARYIRDPAVLNLLPLNNVADLDNFVYMARSDPARHQVERQRIVQYVTAVLRVISPGGLDERLEGRFRNTFLPEFTGGTTLELADAGHIAAFHRFVAGSSDSPLTSVPVRSPRGVTDPRANPAFLTHFASDLAPDGQLLIGARTELDRLWMEGLAHASRVPYM